MAGAPRFMQGRSRDSARARSRPQPYRPLRGTEGGSAGAFTRKKRPSHGGADTGEMAVTRAWCVRAEDGVRPRPGRDAHIPPCAGRLGNAACYVLGFTRTIVFERRCITASYVARSVGYHSGYLPSSRGAVRSPERSRYVTVPVKRGTEAGYRLARRRTICWMAAS